jgi:hypothetical protein
VNSDSFDLVALPKFRWMADRDHPDTMPASREFSRELQGELFDASLVGVEGTREQPDVHTAVD